ncbi:MAG: hypothetical protein HKL99_10635 [Burkholderiales bacterium]|nr:hypothetical protein [Burkholderiales bacterium]
MTPNRVDSQGVLANPACGNRPGAMPAPILLILSRFGSMPVTVAPQTGGLEFINSACGMGKVMTPARVRGMCAKFFQRMRLAVDISRGNTMVLPAAVDLAQFAIPDCQSGSWQPSGSSAPTSGTMCGMSDYYGGGGYEQNSTRCEGYDPYYNGCPSGYWRANVGAISTHWLYSCIAN